MLKNNAVQNPLTSKPSTKWSQSRIIAALITNKNKPNVKIVTGNVNKTKIGFTKKFNNPKTIATVKAVVNSSTRTPFIRYEIAITSIDVTKILTSIFIFYGI